MKDVGKFLEIGLEEAKLIGSIQGALMAYRVLSLQDPKKARESMDDILVQIQKDIDEIQKTHLTLLQFGIE